MIFTYSKLDGTVLLWERMRTAWSKNCLRKSNIQVFIAEELWVVDNRAINNESSVSKRTGLGWHSANFLHNSLYGGVFWICDQNSVAELPGLNDNSNQLWY